jgi:TRAP-type mannitol/chloroaromatic compound transport system permease small subunit
MQGLLKLSRLIDRLNEFLGRWVVWLVLAAVVLSAGNAIVRKYSTTARTPCSRSQWYFFSRSSSLRGYTLLRNEHVRIDVIIGRFSRATQTWIDVLGTIFFLLPMALLFIYLSWPVFVRPTRTARSRPTRAASHLAGAPAGPVGFTLLRCRASPSSSSASPSSPARAPTRSAPRRARREKELAEEIRAWPRRRNDRLPHANMAPIMFASLVIFLLLGYPVAFALAANGIFFG